MTPALSTLTPRHPVQGMKTASQKIMAESGCTAHGGLLGLSYNAWHSAADARYKQDQKQRYCGNCGLCRFEDEAASCPKFRHSPDMDEFYRKESKK